MEGNTAKFFLKHIVGLSWLDESLSKADNVGPRLFCLTCFVVSLKDKWFLATAGHCMKDVTELVSSGKRQITSFYLVDDILKEPKGGIPLLEGTKPDWYYIVDDEKGIDCGFLHLSEYYIRLLKVKGVEPIDLFNFAVTNDTSFQSYGMVGFPAEIIKVETSNNDVMSPIGLAYFPLTRVSDKPLGNNFRDHYQITAIGSVNDIDGVSGGPVFGFVQNSKGGIDYTLVGIQCGWVKNEKRVYCTPANTCGGFLLSILDRWGIDSD